MTKVPNGFIKDSEGNYRRGDYMFKEGQIIKVLKEEENKKEAPKYDTLENCVHKVLSYSGQLGDCDPLVATTYINKVNDGEYEISDKQTKNTEAIITADRQVYYNRPEIKLPDDKDLAPEEGPKAPKTEDLPTEPQELKEGESLTDKKYKILQNKLSPEELFSKIEDHLRGQANGDSIFNNLIDWIWLDYDFKDDLDNQESIKEDEEFPSEEVDDVPSEDPSTQDEEPKEAATLNTAYFVRRPNNIDELESVINKHLVQPSTYKVVDEITLSNEEFDSYLSNLREDKKFLQTFRPQPTDADFTVISVSSEDGRTLLIDNSGYNSAQYVSLI